MSVTPIVKSALKRFFGQIWDTLTGSRHFYDHVRTKRHILIDWLFLVIIVMICFQNMNRSTYTVYSCFYIYNIICVYALSQVQPVKSIVLLSGLHWYPCAAEQLTTTVVL